MPVELKRIAGAVRQDGRLIPISDGEEMPPPDPDPSEEAPEDS